MIPHVEPHVLDEEPLLRPILDEKDGKAGALQPEHHYSTGAHSLILRFNDLLVKVAVEEDGEDRTTRLNSTTMTYAVCGLSACSNSLFWRFLALACRVIYAYYYFNWTIIIGAFAICSLISVVYEAWVSGQILAQAAIVISLFPMILLLWIFFAFLYHVLFWGVWNDFYDFEASLQAIKSRLKSMFSKSLLIFFVGVLINLPVVVAFIVFAVQIAQNVTDRLWAAQFFLSFGCNLALAFLFFGGALLGQDHPPLSPRGGNTVHAPWWWCSCLPLCVLTSMQTFFRSNIFNAMRVYGRSTFHGGGAFTENFSTWGKYANAAYLPQPVDLDGTAIMEIDEDEEERNKYQDERNERVKQWPTPWNLGWYIKLYCIRTLDRSRFFPIVVRLPWTLLLLITVILLASIAFVLRAYALTGFVIFYFAVLPAFYTISARLIGKRPYLVLVDVILIVALVAAFFLSLSVSSFYLGFPIIFIILLANTLTLIAHLPAIRDRKLPPPRNHAQCLAFHTKATTHRIITTARAWGFFSIIFLLVLVLVMRTVPAQYGKATASSHRYKAPPAGDVQAQPYAFCGQEFSKAGLSVLSLAKLSNAAYMEMGEAVQYIHDEVPSARNFNISLLQFAEYGPITYLLQDDSTQTLLFAIRGTNEAFDLFQDLDSYAEAITISLATSLFPLYANPIFQTLLDKFVGTTSHLVEAINILKDALLNRQKNRESDTTTTTQGKGGTGKRYYYDQLYSYIKDNVLTKDEVKGYEMVFTGHSLGGGVASIVAARFKALAITFSAPGVVLSRKKFKIKLKNINDYLINVYSEGDLVPLIDVQSVKSQQLKCSNDRLSYHCHSILHTIDEIYSSCGVNR